MAMLTKEQLDDCKTKAEQILEHVAVMTGSERGAMTEAEKMFGVRQQYWSKIAKGTIVGADIYARILEVWRQVFGVSRQFEITVAYASEIIYLDKARLNKAVDRLARTPIAKSEDPEKILAALLMEYGPKEAPSKKGKTA